MIRAADDEGASMRPATTETGRPNGSFRPGSIASRNEAAIVICMETHTTDNRTTYHIECRRTGATSSEFRDVYAASRDEAIAHIAQNLRDHGPHGIWTVDHRRVDARQLNTYPIEFRQVGHEPEIREVRGANREDAISAAMQEMINHGPRGTSWTIAGRPCDPGRAR